ncbi:MAG: response regulator transcription factor [Magnetococcales bacterium]|nr:response regulator transcription factor [Magnetococcales bacterium]
MITIFIADDHPLLREGVKALLAAEGDLAVVGASGTGQETLHRLRKEVVDLLLLDLHLPDMDGFEVLQRVKKLRPELRVLVVTLCAEESMAFRVLRAGASGYLVKDALPEELVKAVRAVHLGRRYLSPETASRMVERFVDPEEVPIHDRLTNREFQVFKRLASGMTVSGIARELNLASSTVSTHRAHILDKLELTSVTALIRYAVDHGLVE